MILILLSGLLVSCVGATRLPVRTHGPAGAQFQASQLDMRFLESPAVQQKDVADKLASIDTGYHDPHLFWGRWADSKWGYWWLVVAAVPGGGGGTPAAAGDAKRIWHVKNLLVTFDDNGVMQKREVIDDDRILWRRLHEHAAAMPPLDMSQPEFLSVEASNSQSILLHKEYFEVTGKRGPLRIAPTSVVQFSHDSAGTSAIPRARLATPCTLRKKPQRERSSITAAMRSMSSRSSVICRKPARKR